MAYKLKLFLHKTVHKPGFMPSSVIANMIYDPASSTLRVIFVSGAVYDYKKVPAKIYRAMKAAGSKGTYFNKYIKGNYSFKQVSL